MVRMQVPSGTGLVVAVPVMVHRAGANLSNKHGFVPARVYVSAERQRHVVGRVAALCSDRDCSLWYVWYVRLEVVSK